MSAIKVNGTWQQVVSVKVKRNAVWVDHTAFYSRLEGAWHVIDLNAEAVGPAYHVWKAYADDEQGNGISLLPEGKEYIGFAVGQTTEQPKLADPSIFDWSLIKGTDGDDVDPEVLNEILTKQDDIAVAVDDVESRLKAADGGLASALATAEHNFTVSLNKANALIVTTDERITDGVSRIDTAVEGLDATIKSTDTRLTSNIALADSKIASAATAIGNVQNDITGLSSLTGSHGSAIVGLETITDEQAQRVAVLETSNGESKARVITLEETSEGHASRLTNVETKSTSAVTKADAAQGSANSANTKVATVTNRVGTLEETSTGHASRLTSVETASTTAESKADDAQGTADSGVIKANAAQAKANSVDTRVTTVTNRVGTLEETSTGHASRLTNVETKSTSAVTKADDAQDTANAATTIATAATNRVSTLEETSEGHASRLSTVETKAVTAVTKADDAQGTADSGVSKANTAQAKANLATTKVTAVTNRVGTLEETSAGHASRLTNVETTATTATTKADAAQAKANSANTKVTAVTNRVVTLESTSTGHASRLTTVETKATTGVNKANAAQTKANSADSKATSATNRVSSLEETSEDYATRFTAVETVADSAVDKADTAQSAADAADNKAVAATNRVTTLEETSSDYATRFTSVESRAEIGVSKANTAQSTANTANSRAVDARSRATVLEQATADSAARIEEVNSNQNGAVASAKSIARAYTDSTTGILKAERVIKADANGKVSGVHLLSKGSGVDAGGKLYFQADEIAIVPPNWNGSSELDKSKFPFYFSEDRNYMYLDEAVIRQLSAETIDSGRLAVDGIAILSDDITMPPGAIREHMIDPAFKDGLVRVSPDGVVLGGTQSITSKGVGFNKKISVPALKSGGSAQTMNFSVSGPNEAGLKDVAFDVTMKLNGAAHNFTVGKATIRLSANINYSTEEGGHRLYRTSFNFSEQVILPAPTKGLEYTYEFTISNITFNPKSVVSYNYADKLFFAVSVSEPTISSGGFITDVRWKDVKEQPSYLGIDTSGSSSYPRMFPANNPASSGSWVRTTSSGLLPYANNKSNLGTSSWKFKEVHSVNFYENGVSLGSKYLGKTATATNADKLDNINSSQFLRSDKGGTVEGQLTIRHTNVQLNLMDSTYENNYWQFDHQSGTLGFRYNGGDIAFRLNKGGTAAFAHEVSAPSFSESGTKLSSKYLGKTATATNADKLGGRSYATGITGNSIASRDSAGDIHSRLFRSRYGSQSDISGAIAFRNSTSDNYIRFCSNMSSVRAFVDVYSKGEANGRYLSSSENAVTSGRIVGVMDGKVALTANDGYGNANITFNHANGRPIRNGNAARIEVNTDASNDPFMSIGLGGSVTNGEATGLTDVLWLDLSEVKYRDNKIYHTGNTSHFAIKSESDSKYLGKDETAVRADFLEYHNQVVYGRSGLQASNVAGSGGEGTDNTALENPTNDWWYHITANHANGGGYYFDIACSFHTNRMMFKRVSSGSSGGWQEFFHTDNMGSGSGLDADKLDGFHATSFARIGTTSPTSDYLYVHRDSSNPAFYAVQSGAGDIARFITGSKGLTDYTRGALINNEGSVVTTGQLIAEASSIGSNQVAGIFKHPTRNANVAIVSKNASKGAFRFEANADEGELRIQTSTAGGAYSSAGGDRGNIAAFRRNGDFIVNGVVDINGGLRRGVHTFINSGDTWIRTNSDDGIYFSSHGGGLYMIDSEWVRTYGGKALFSSSTNSLQAINTDGGIRFKQQLYSTNPTGEGGIVGNYKTLGYGVDEMIWTIGTDWRTHATHFGLGYHYGREVDGERRHQIVIKQSGVIGIWLGMEGDARFNGVIRAKATTGVVSRVITYDDFLPSTPPAGLENTITASWIGAGAINARHLQVNSLVNNGGSYTSLKIAPDAVRPIALSRTDSAGKEISPIFYVDTKGNGFFDGKLSKNTVDIESIQDEARRQINPYYVGTVAGGTQSGTNKSLNTGGTYVLPAITVLGGKVNLSWVVSGSTSYLNGSGQQGYSTPNWRVEIFRGTTSNTRIVNRTYTGTSFQHVDNEYGSPSYGRWEGSSSIHIDDQISDNYAASGQRYTIRVTRLSGTSMAISVRSFTGKSPAFKQIQMKYDYTSLYYNAAGLANGNITLSDDYDKYEFLAVEGSEDNDDVMGITLIPTYVVKADVGKFDDKQFMLSSPLYDKYWRVSLQGKRGLIEHGENSLIRRIWGVNIVEKI
ncbi:MAG: hypothetical protein ACI9NY_000157 [Kiritimatiellia bacterium]|jgi:hypothetical protein